MYSLVRRPRPSITDQAIDYIASQPHGAGTWPDGAVITPPRTRIRLVIADKVGTDREQERWIEVRHDGRLVATLVYGHHSKCLMRTF